MLCYEMNKLNSINSVTEELNRNRSLYVVDERIEAVNVEVLISICPMNN